jgi:hypothetical protein
MEYKQFNFLDMVAEAMKAKTGCHLIIMRPLEDEPDLCDIYSFKSKEEFDKEFETKKHPYYPGNIYIPRIIKRSFGNSVDCVIDGENYYIQLTNIRLIIDGKFVK